MAARRCARNGIASRKQNTSFSHTGAGAITFEPSTYHYALLQCVVQNDN